MVFKSKSMKIIFKIVTRTVKRAELMLVARVLQRMQLSVAVGAHCGTRVLQNHLMFYAVWYKMYNVY